MHWQNLDCPAFLKKIVNYLGNKFFFLWNYFLKLLNKAPKEHFDITLNLHSTEKSK